MREKWSKIGHTLLNILLVVSLLCALSIGVTSITSRKPSVFGFRVLNIMSASMEPTIMTDQLVLGKVTDGSEIVIGDIVAYRESDGLRRTIIHRVIDIYENDGVTYYVFQGDNNQIPDDPITADMFLYKIIWY